MCRGVRCRDVLRPCVRASVRHAPNGVKTPSKNLKYHYSCSETRKGLVFFWCEIFLSSKMSLHSRELVKVRKIFSRFPESANTIFCRSRLMFLDHFRGSTPENASGAMSPALNYKITFNLGAKCENGSQKYRKSIIL